MAIHFSNAWVEKYHQIKYDEMLNVTTFWKLELTLKLSLIKRDRKTIRMSSKSELIEQKFFCLLFFFHAGPGTK